MKILLVEDDPSCRTATAMLLEYLGYFVDTAAGGEEALACFQPNLHQIVITDLLMPGMSGEQLVVEIKRRSPTTPIAVYTGATVADVNGADAVLAKPASIEDFRKPLSGLCALSRSTKEKLEHVAKRSECSRRGGASSQTRPRSSRCRQSLRGTLSREE